MVATTIERVRMEFSGEEPGLLDVLKCVGQFYTSVILYCVQLFNGCSGIHLDEKLIYNYLNLETNPISWFYI